MSDPDLSGDSCHSSRERLVLLLMAAVIGIITTAFFWPWLARSQPAGGLSRYAPLEDGAARLSVVHDAEGKPEEWVSSNDRCIPPGLAVGAELRKTQREAIGVLFRKPGEPAIEEMELVSRLAGSQLYQTRSRTLDAAGKVAESVYLSVRNKHGDFLVSVTRAEQDGDIIFDPPLPALPGNFTTGHTWSVEGARRMGGQSARYTYAGRVLGREALENAAGRFEDCVKIETKISISQDSKMLHEGTTLYWLARGIGVVEWRAQDPTGKVSQRSVMADAGSLPPVPAPLAAAARSDASRAGIAPQANWKMTRFASVRAGIDAAANTVPATWVPADPPLVLAARHAGDLTAFDPRGRTVWRFHPTGVIYGPPAWDAKRARIYFGATDKKLYALDVRGLFLWSFLTGDNVASRPVIAGDVVVFGSEDRHIYGLDANTGRLKWRTPTGGPVVSSPALVGGSVIIGSDDGAIYALDPATGQERWKYEGDDPIESPIVAGADGRVFAATQQGDLLALNAVDGRLLWSENAGSTIEAAPAPGGKLVFVVAHGRLSAFEQAGGRRVWRTDKNHYTGTPVVLDDAVIVAGHDGSVHWVDLEGKEQHRWTAAESNGPGEAAAGLRFGPTVGGDALWLADQGSIVRRLGAETSGPALLKPAWVRRFTDAPFERSFLSLTPAPYGEQAVVLDSARSIFLLDPRSGEGKRVGGFGESGAVTIDPVTTGNVLLAVCGTTLYAVQLPGGALLWKRSGDGATLRPVSVAGDTVLWLTQRDAGGSEPVGAGTLFALELATGAVRWKKSLSGFPGPGGAVAHSGTVFTSTPPLAFDLATGATRWEAKAAGLALGGPALSETGDRLFVGLADANTGAGRIAAMDSTNGKVLWQAPLGDSSLNPLERVWQEGDVLLVPLWNGGITALDAVTGAERWRHQPGTSRLGAITVANGRVWLMQQNLEVVGLDARNGDVVARFALDIDLSSLSSFAPRVLVMGNRLLAPFAMMLLGLDLER